jgi:hypothetical protein
MENGVSIGHLQTYEMKDRVCQCLIARGATLNKEAGLGGEIGRTTVAMLDGEHGSMTVAKLDGEHGRTTVAMPDGEDGRPYNQTHPTSYT